jgi:hypothetical protein
MSVWANHLGLTAKSARQQQQQQEQQEQQTSGRSRFLFPQARIFVAPPAGPAPPPRAASAKIGKARRPRRGQDAAQSAARPTTQPAKPGSGGGEAAAGQQRSFIERMEASGEAKRAALEKRRAKEAYDAQLDKKQCPTCGVQQSYDELVSKRDRCPKDGDRYRNRNTWGDVQQSFMERNLAPLRAKIGL